MVWLEKKTKKLDLPKNFGASQYIKRLPYIRNEDPSFQNSVFDIVNNRSDLKALLLARSKKLLVLSHSWYLKNKDKKNNKRRKIIKLRCNVIFKISMEYFKA